jgi:AcrR family transcriptional regulator
VVKLARPRARTAIRRREIAVARTRDEILLAAARALARSGHKAVSMSDIAAEVGFTAPALYAYFSSKEQIFEALVAMLAQEIGETFVTPPRGLPFREKLRLLVREALAWADRRRDFLQALFALKLRGHGPADTMQNPQRVPHLPRSSAASKLAGSARVPGPPAWDEYTPRMAEWLRQAGRRSPELAGRDPAEAACVLVGIMHGFFLRWLSAHPGSPGRQSGLGWKPGAPAPPGQLHEQSDRIVDYFLYGIQGGAAHA